MGAQQQRVAVPLYGLVAGVVLVLVAGVLAFLSDVPLVALGLFMVGVVGMGASGDALRGLLCVNGD